MGPAQRPDRQAPVRSVPNLPKAQPTDIRAAAPLGLSATRLALLVRRGLSIVTLATIDVVGLGVGLYGALVLRELYYGRAIDSGALWRAEKEWLPFLILITLLVFVHGHLYSGRERRP